MIYTLLGLVILAVAVYFIREKTLLNLCTAETEAVLSHVDECEAREANYVKVVSYSAAKFYYVPIYEFRVDGMVYRVRTKDYTSNPATIRDKTTCKVKYNPRRPAECFLDGKKGKVIMTFEEENGKNENA